jgi:dihydroxy-acid dehydratase
MSGTTFGIAILLVALEIGRSLTLLLSDQDIAGRLSEWRKMRPAQRYKRGYYQLYVEHVLQADKGCDLDFLVGASGSTVVRESH